MTRFREYIGIDYSGAGTPLTRMSGLQVYAATNDGLPERVSPPSTPNGRWSRKDGANLSSCLKRRERLERIDVLPKWRQVWSQPRLDMATCERSPSVKLEETEKTVW